MCGEVCLWCMHTLERCGRCLFSDSTDAGLGLSAAAGEVVRGDLTSVSRGVGGSWDALLERRIDLERIALWRS